MIYILPINAAVFEIKNKLHFKNKYRRRMQNNNKHNTSFYR